MKNATFPSNDTDTQRLAEAAAWRVHLMEAGTETTLDFENWLAQDLRNLSAWQRVQSHWAFLGDQATTPELLAVRLAALEQARRTSERRWVQRLWSSQSRLRAVAASLLLIALGSLLWWGLISPDIYKTVTGERRLVTLSDGSQFSLDSESEVRVSYTRHSRELQLMRGQARFAVARDVERPFSVVADGRRIVATGTEFNVDLLAADLFVTLIEGHVVVLPGETPSSSRNASARGAFDPALAKEIELEAGEQLTFLGDAAPSIRVVDVALATAWENGQLVIENEPLSSVAARVSRYSNQTLRIEDPRTAELRISGVFTAGDVDGFVTTITSYLPVQADMRTPGEIALRHR